MLPTMIIPLPREEVNPFRGAFLLRFSPGDLPASGDLILEWTRCGSAPATSRGRAAHGGRAGFRSIPSSFPQSDLSHAGKKRDARRISVYPLARACPRPGYDLMPPAGGFRFALPTEDERGAPSYIYKHSYMDIYSVCI